MADQTVEQQLAKMQELLNQLMEERANSNRELSAGRRSLPLPSTSAQMGTSVPMSTNTSTRSQPSTSFAAVPAERANSNRELSAGRRSLPLPSTSAQMGTSVPMSTNTSTRSQPSTSFAAVPADSRYSRHMRRNSDNFVFTSRPRGRTNVPRGSTIRYLRRAGLVTYLTFYKSDSEETLLERFSQFLGKFFTCRPVPVRILSPEGGRNKGLIFPNLASGTLMDGIMAAQLCKNGKLYVLLEQEPLGLNEVMSEGDSESDLSDMDCGAAQVSAMHRPIQGLPEDVLPDLPPSLPDLPPTLGDNRQDNQVTLNPMLNIFDKEMTDVITNLMTILPKTKKEVEIRPRKLHLIEDLTNYFMDSEYNWEEKPLFNIEDAEGRCFALDMGGPGKQVHHELIYNLKRKITSGRQADGLMFIYNYRALQDRQYELLGKAVCSGLINYGMVPRCFAKALYEMLLHGVDEYIPDEDDVVDYEIVEGIMKLRERETWQDGINQLTPTLQSMGMTTALLSLKDNNRIIEDVIEFEAKERCRQCMEQFMKGLGPIINIMRANEQLFRHVLMKTPHFLPNITAEGILAMYGEVDGEREKAVLDMFGQYIASLDIQSLTDMAVFLWGCPEYPLLGFDEPRVEFRESGLPMTHTCVFIVVLPLDCIDSQDMGQRLQRCISETKENAFSIL